MWCNLNVLWLGMCNKNTFNRLPLHRESRDNGRKENPLRENLEKFQIYI